MSQNIANLLSSLNNLSAASVGHITTNPGNGRVVNSRMSRSQILNSPIPYARDPYKRTKTYVPEIEKFGGVVDPNALAEELAKSGLNLAAAGSLNPFSSPFALGLGLAGAGLGGLGAALGGSSGSKGSSGSSRTSNDDGETEETDEDLTKKAEEIADKFDNEDNEAEIKAYLKDELNLDDDKADKLFDSLKRETKEERVKTIKQYLNKAQTSDHKAYARNNTFNNLSIGDS